MTNKSLKLNGIHYGELTVTTWDTAISITICDGRDTKIIGLAVSEIMQLRDFLNNILGTKKDDSK